jgi:nucleoside-diphosphate-sugar epimerase
LWKVTLIMSIERFGINGYEYMITLVTGANGFVGSALCSRLRREGVSLRAAVRSSRSQLDEVVVGNLSSKTNWTFALSGVEEVVHLAARVHIMNDSDSLAEFRRVNVEGTAALARQAAAAGVRRFVFLSTIKVNGEFTREGQFFTAADLPATDDPYGISKYEAEQLLLEIGSETGMEVVIIRPPLIYGPGVKANFESMMSWLARDVPLPLAAVNKNRRSFVALSNLVDLIITCLRHPAAADQIFLVSDGEDLSTADLLKRVGSAMGHPARLIYLPTGLIKLAATVVKKPGIYQRVCGSLQVDITRTREQLGWIPPITVDEGLKLTVAGFRR